MHIFYTPDIRSEEYILNEEESRHCIKVLRLTIGALVHLVDGVGGLYVAEIIGVDKRNVRLKVIRVTREYKKRDYQLHIAVAPTKNIDRLEWFLEKATEIGIDEVTPIITERSERRVVKEDRLFKVMTSAIKQSLQAYHPILNSTVSFSDFISRSWDSNKMIAHCLSDEYKSPIQRSPNSKYLVLIGPEGDFSPGEIESALGNDFKAVTLGDTRLRTETAALAACFEVNYLNR